MLTSKNFFFLFYISYLFFVNIKSEKLYISTVDEFYNIYNGSDDDDIILTNSIVVNKDIKWSNIPKKVIHGLNKNVTIEFTNKKGFSFSDMEYVEFQDITIIGKILIKRVSNSTFYNVSYSGLFNTRDQRNKQLFFTYSTFYSEIIKEGRENLIRLYYGNYYFNHCIFYGKKEATDSIIKLTSDSGYPLKDSISFYDCIFNGNYVTSSIIAFYVTATIDHCYFYNNYNTNKG